ncbi:MAG: glycoside hydrolase family 3 N-terminal domain-containing protein [Spirochaetota bacterium]
MGTANNEGAMYLNASLACEKRAADLLKRMSLDEKIAQLQAASVDLWKISRNLFPYLTPDQRDRLANTLLKNPESNMVDIYESISVNEWLNNWKAKVIAGDGISIGHLSYPLRYFSPAAGADFANAVKKYVKENTRLGIPVLFHEECLHGCAAKSSTSFPQSIGLSSSWNPGLVYRVAKAIGKEARARGIHQGLSPTINIARDPRCGRVEETYGEDPFLTSALAVAYTRGLQSEKVAAALKHYAANFVGDGGRDSSEIHFSERILKEVYFPAFKEAVQKGNALSVMSAYNAIDGVPCSANSWLLSKVLREEWGFKGMVVSDYGAVGHLVSRHKTAETKADAARQAVTSGLDIELPESDCYKALTHLVTEDEILQRAVDDCVYRLLYVKFALGLFDEDDLDPDYAEKITHCIEHRALALEAARESIVLLKNTGILPLTKKIRSIAVIGPNAAKGRLGGYSVYNASPISPLEGIRSRAGGHIEVRFAEGCSLTGSSKAGFEQALELSRQSDVAVLFMGNSSGTTEGEQFDRSNLDLPGVQEELIRIICTCARPVIVVLIGGSSVTMSKWVEYPAAIIEAWYPGEEGGNAIADVLFGLYNPGGKLPLTFPRSIGQLPLYYNHKPSGQVYDYVDLKDDQSLFPFGFGLNYSSFEYRDLIIAPARVDKGEKVEIKLHVKNCGDYDGDEIVQLYIHDSFSSVSRPVIELKGFERTHLKRGEQKEVSFFLTEEEYGFYDEHLKWGCEAGEIVVMVGASSRDIRLKGSFFIK